jgi:hypothetical protein
MSERHTAAQNYIKTNDKNVSENVTKHAETNTYFATAVTNHNCIQAETKSRLNSKNVFSHAFHKIFTSRLLFIKL